MTNRPQGMSQLDYLWTHFGAYEVSNEASQVPSENIILTEQALTDLIQKSTSGGITALTYREHPTKDDIMQLIGTSINGSELTVVEMPKEVHVQSFQRRRVTQIDIDNGCQFPLDSEVLSLILTNGTEFLVNLSDIDLLLSSKDSNTIATDVTNGVIQSSLKIDERNNDISTVQIHTTSNGIYTDINVSDEDTGIKIEKTDKGLTAYIPMGDNKVRFQQLTLDQYLVLEPKDQTTFYLITDIPYIFFGGVRYGSGLETSDTPIVSLVYDADHMLLSYKKVGEDITQIHLGPADENTPGMMSTESYVDLQNLKNKLGEIDSIPDYIDEQVDQLAYSLELGEPHNNTRPLRLIAKNGGILSTIDLDVENFLQQAENRIATAQDVIDSGDKVVEGHQILVLTLTSGDKVYVDLNSLVTDFTVSDTDTIDLNLVNSNFTANLKINNGEKIIHAGPNGIQSYWQVVQADNTVTFYGLNQTLEYRLGQIVVPDVLQEFQFKGQITAEEVIQFPPRTVDCVDYDYDTNPVIIGDPYVILGYGTNDTIHYEYISIKPLYQAIQLSQKEHNTLTKGDDGFLYNEDKSVVSGELEGGILTLHLGNDTTVLIPLPEATGESSGLLSAEDKGKLDEILGEEEGSISDIKNKLNKVISDVDNIGNVIIPEMNENTAKALDGKVDWDETKTVITLPINGSIAATQNSETGEGGVLICQRDYGEGNVTEVGNVRNKLTFNATERPQIDLAGGSQEKIAYESDLIKYGMFYPGVKVDTRKLFALTKSSTETDIKAALQLETASGSYTLPTESILNDCLGKGYQLLSNWMPVNVAWNGAAWVFYLVGQTYMKQPNAVATVSIKITDGVYSVFQAAKVTELASIDDLKLMPNAIRFPLRTLQDKVYTQEEILEWFGVTEVSELKQKIVRGGIYYLQYGISLSGNPMYYKMPVEYVAFESANQIKLVFNGLNTRDDVPSKYEIIINTDGTIIEGNSNVKLTITPLSTQPEEIQDQIQSNIVQELGQDTTKVISQKVVTDNISKINADLNSLNTKVGNQKTEQQEATGIYKIIEDNKALADAAISEMIPLSQKGSVNGVASLDENGKVPSTQLPGFVDDVLEYDNFEAFPETGETGKIYVTKDTNLEYRWSGTQYTQISKSIGIGETSSTAYAGDKGKQVTDRVAEVYSANSVINGLSDIIFDSDNIEAQTLSADNAIKTWDSSNTLHDLKIPYATTIKAGAMSATDKAKLDQLTEGLSDDTPSMSEVVENINTITQNITDIQGDITNIENSIGDTSNLTTEATNLTDAINEHETQINTISNDVFNLKNNTVKSIQVGTNEAITPVEGLVTIPNATSEADGTMSKEDKTKLDKVIDNGDGMQFLSNDGTYKTITTNLSDDYTASAESSEPAAGDTYETAISKLHKTILDLTSRIADLEQALTLKTV